MSLPEPFVQQMNQILGAEQLQLFQQALNSPSPVSIRENNLKGFKWKENFGKVKWNSNGVYLSRRPNFTLDPTFHAGAYYVQEASSMLIAAAIEQLLDVSKSLKVLDLCSAPGGKSTLLASLLTPNSFLLANEVIKSRYQILKYNLAKWGSPNSHSCNHDARDFSRLPNFFDLILVDAPCSGEGLFRKDEGAISEWSGANVQLCSQRQKRILAEAVKSLSPGGVLIYCTCTYNSSENSENANWLTDHFDLELAPLSFPESWGIVPRKPGWQCYPHLVQGEGFYLVALRKKGTGRSRKIGAKGFKKLQKLSKKEAEMVKPWIDQGQSINLFKNEFGVVRAILNQNLEDAYEVARLLSRLSMGTIVGSIKHKDFIPSPELALSLLVSSECPALELDRQQALHFLSKEPIPLSTNPQGWHLVKYKGLNLGWIKGLKNRINNYYPKEWRIRMSWE